MRLRRWCRAVGGEGVARRPGAPVSTSCSSAGWADTLVDKEEEEEERAELRPLFAVALEAVCETHVALECAKARRRRAAAKRARAEALAAAAEGGGGGGKKEGGGPSPSAVGGRR